jgi:hypothetical protein
MSKESKQAKRKTVSHCQNGQRTMRSCPVVWSSVAQSGPVLRSRMLSLKSSTVRCSSSDSTAYERPKISEAIYFLSAGWGKNGAEHTRASSWARSSTSSSSTSMQQCCLATKHSKVASSRSDIFCTRSTSLWISILASVAYLNTRSTIRERN